MHRIRALAPALVIAAVFLVAPPRPASAVVTSTWEVDSYTEWNEGKATAALVSSLGEVRPGWATARSPLEFDSSWAAVRLADGTIVLGTDQEGALYAVRGGKASKLGAIEGAVAVVSLALGSDGTLYAGTMPGGAIWKVDTRSGAATKLVALPGAETVWGLAFDAGGKHLYAGTGPEGKLFAVDVKSGKAEVAFASEDKRVMAVVGTRDGAVWFGTSEKAILYRYDPAKKNARAMADFDGNEITALAEIGDGVVAAANTFVEPSTTGPKTKAGASVGAKKLEAVGEAPKTPKTGSTPGADDTPPTAGAIARPGARKGKGALYRVAGDGRLEQLHALTQTYFTALAVTADNQIFAAAGDEGRIYLIGGDDSVSTAFDVEERQVLQVLVDGKGVSFTTGDTAAYYTSTGPAAVASYESKVYDAKAPSRFGNFMWHGAGTVKLETRTGNTAEPGKGWSEWQAPASVGRGGGESQGGRIASPPGRYVQFRASFNGDAGAVVRRTTLYFLPQNRATQLTEVKVGASGARELVTMQASATKARSPIIKITWKVENADGDETAYRLAIRREGEVVWRSILPPGKPLTATEFEWNTEAFPDGYYRVRVTATDSQANVADRALERHLTSAIVLVDNDKPSLSALTVKYPAVSARATDAMSPIAEMSFQVDEGPWQLGAAQDGIYDDMSEALKFALPAGLEPGLHTLSIRVADQAGNVGASSVTFQIGK